MVILKMFFSQNRDENDFYLKCEQFLQVFHMSFKKGLNASFDITSGVSRNTTQRLQICSLREILKKKTVLNEEIPANKWQKKVKHIEIGRNDFCSDYEEL